MWTWFFRGLFQSNLTLIEDETCLLEAAHLSEEENLLVEVRDKDQTWPEEMSLLAKNPDVKIRSNRTFNLVSLEKKWIEFPECQWGGTKSVMKSHYQTSHSLMYIYIYFFFLFFCVLFVEQFLLLLVSLGWTTLGTRAFWMPLCSVYRIRHLWRDISWEICIFTNWIGENF